MLHHIQNVFYKHANKLAFHIGKDKYSYADYLKYISGIRQMLQKEKLDSHFIGLAANDDIETYAAILAIWAEGYAFVPLSLQNPSGRNTNVLQQLDCTLVLSSRDDNSMLLENSNFSFLSTSGLQAKLAPPDFSTLAPDQILCMLFTSGSTGVPKGVPYTTKNINSTLDSFFALGYTLSENDRFLQMFELTFDMSMLSYLPAWCIGASVHTVDNIGIKNLNAVKVMQEQELSFVTLVPSTLQLLKPYFSQIKLPAVRYCQLGGEPFYTDLAAAWMACIPNALLINISGPCETTMACMSYPLDRDFSKNKSHKDILAFGYPWKNTTVLLLNDQEQPAAIGEIGELCFAGDHVMEGYWQLPEKNNTLFFEKKIDHKLIRFYRSGDMAFQDKDGLYYSCGRKDIQYKIQGYKVELGDIEKHARNFLQKGNAAALVDRNEKGLLDIYLFIDQTDLELNLLSDYLKNHLPAYMLPRKIKVLKQLPLTISGKLDRGKLAAIFEGNDFDYISDDEMSARILDNLFASYRKAAQLIGLPIWQEGTIEAVNAGTSAWPRTIFGTPEILHLKNIASQIRADKLPPQLIMLRPENPETLYSNLSEQGFRHLMSWPGMAIDLTDQSFSENTTELKLVETEATFQEWLSIVNNSLFKTKPLDEQLLKKVRLSDQFLFFGLFQNKNLVATAMCFVHQNRIGIYMVATDESQRRKGFAHSLTLQILQFAKDRGYQAAYLQASGMAASLYTKIGFKTFCTLDIFWLLGVR